MTGYSFPCCIVCRQPLKCKVDRVADLIADVLYHNTVVDCLRGAIERLSALEAEVDEIDIPEDCHDEVANLQRDIERVEERVTEMENNVKEFV